jgi:polyribonucleotide nucleotidyltransferase
LIVISLENCFQDLVGAELEEVLQINGKQLRGAAIRRLEDRVLGALTEEGICKELAAMPKEVPQEAQVSSWEEEELIVDEGLVDEGDVHVTPVPKKPITELFDPVHVKRMFKEVSSDVLRRLVIQVQIADHLITHLLFLGSKCPLIFPVPWR